MRAEGGSVTAETAVALPALVMVLATALWALAAAGARIECIDAARAAARAAARGEALDAVRSAAQQAAPHDAQVAVRRGQGLVRVRVSVQVEPVGTSLIGMPTLTVGGKAAAAVEGR